MTPSFFVDTAKLLLDNLSRLKPDASGSTGWDVKATFELLRRGIRQEGPRLPPEQRVELARVLTHHVREKGATLRALFPRDSGASQLDQLEIDCMDAGLWLRASGGDFAPPSPSDVWGWAQLVHSALKGRQEAVMQRLLSDASCPPASDLVGRFPSSREGSGVPSRWGREPLDGWAWVVRNCASPGVRALLLRGADPNVTDAQGRPLLAYATNPETIRALFDAGADPLGASLPLPARARALSALSDAWVSQTVNGCDQLSAYVQRSLSAWSEAEKDEVLEPVLQAVGLDLITKASSRSSPFPLMQQIQVLNGCSGRPEKSLPRIQADGYTWSCYAYAVWSDLCLPTDRRAKPGSIENVWPQPEPSNDGVPDVVWSWMAAFAQGASSRPAWDAAMASPENRAAALVALDRMLAHPRAWQGGFAFLRNLLVVRRDGVAGDLREEWRLQTPDLVDRALRAAWGAPPEDRTAALATASPFLSWLERPRLRCDERYPEWLAMALASGAPGPTKALKRDWVEIMAEGWALLDAPPEVHTALQEMQRAHPDAHSAWSGLALNRAAIAPESGSSSRRLRL